ncbi:hypothetical protein J4E81_004243 [Alternaria sp. BMP 2799]|nr:hypothetical protein J4E81_004243 [Alternaria sp. BMP 2799]
MAGMVAKYAMKKALGKEMEKYKSKDVSGPYDPYYALQPDPKRPHKMKKVKKDIPNYIPENDCVVLAKARKSAYRLDYALFTFMGIRFGWSSVIGLAPAVGDAAGSALALNLVRNMCKVEGGLPASVLIMMLFNVAFDFLIGLVPFIGDLADAAVKANGKNVRLLEEHLDKLYKPKELADRDSKLPRERRPRPASVYVDFDDEIDGRRNTFEDDHDDVRHPQRSYGGGRVHDEEMGGRYDNQPQRSRRDDRPSRNNTRSSRR